MYGSNVGTNVLLQIVYSSKVILRYTVQTVHSTNCVCGTEYVRLKRYTYTRCVFRAQMVQLRGVHRRVQDMCSSNYGTGVLPIGNKVLPVYGVQKGSMAQTGTMSSLARKVLCLRFP